MGYLTQANIDSTDYTLAGALYGTCSTPAYTAAKVVTLPAFNSLETGVTIHVKFTDTNSAVGATLNVNSTGAKNILAGPQAVGNTSNRSWVAGGVVSFTYDGMSWVMNDWIPNTDNSVTQNGTTTNSDYPILFKYSATQTVETNTVRYGNTTGKVPKINPSTGNITGATFNGYALQDACEKTVDTSIASGSTSTNLPTTAAVADYVDSAVATATAGGLSYHGTASALTDITDTNYKKGWYWVADDSFSWTKTTGNVTETISVDPGDMIIAHQDKTSTVGDDLDAVQSNIVALTTAEIDADWAAA